MFSRCRRLKLETGMIIKKIKNKKNQIKPNKIVVFYIFRIIPHKKTYLFHRGKLSSRDTDFTLLNVRDIALKHNKYVTRREVLIVFSIPKVWKSRQRKPRYRWPYRVVITARYKTWTDLYNSLNVARLNSMDILSFFLFVGLVEFHTSRSGGNHGCWCHYWTRVRNSPQRKLGLPSTASVYTNHSKKKYETCH